MGFGLTGMSRGGVGGYMEGAATPTSGTAGDITGGIGSIAGAVSGIINSALSYDAAMKNLEEQKRMNDYYKSLQNTIFSREDSATYRRVMDLKASGLSPVLAAGAAAGTGQAIMLNTPQHQAPQLPDMANAAQLAMAAMKMKADISATQAQEKLLKQQAAASDAQKNLTDVTTAIKYHDYKIMKDTGMSSSPTTVGKWIQEIVEAEKDTMAKKVVKHLTSPLPFEWNQEKKGSKEGSATGEW